jgi:NAD(P)-dependent dehydrogenase (short-subunit alcohol dehydrogenase family)
MFWAVNKAGMPYKFDNQSALVTGAASGIGLATARLLARCGAKPIVATDWVAETIASSTADIEFAIPLAGNVADENFWTDATPYLTGLRLAVVNAGVSSSGMIDAVDLSEWRRVMSANLDGAFLTLRAAIRAMKDHGMGGSIVVTASASGLNAEQGIAAYGASKAGVLHLARIAAKEAAPYNIRVNAIAPAGVKTPIWRGTRFFEDLVQEKGGEDAAFSSIASATTPLGRFASADEIALQIAFLLSDQAATITGATLTSDGGYLL